MDLRLFVPTVPVGPRLSISDFPVNTQPSNPILGNLGTWPTPHDMRLIRAARGPSHIGQSTGVPILPVYDPPVNARIAIDRAPDPPARQSQRIRTARECECPYGCQARRRNRRASQLGPLTFTRRDDMIRHLRTQHGHHALADFQCLVCTDPRGHGPREDIVSRHCDRDHHNVAAYGCNSCVFRTMDRAEIRQHWREHPDHAIRYAGELTRFRPYRRVQRAASAAPISPSSTPLVTPSASFDAGTPPTTPLASQLGNSATHSWQLAVPSSSSNASSFNTSSLASSGAPTSASSSPLNSSSTMPMEETEFFHVGSDNIDN